MSEHLDNLIAFITSDIKVITEEITKRLKNSKFLVIVASRNDYTRFEINVKRIA